MFIWFGMFTSCQPHIVTLGRKGDRMALNRVKYADIVICMLCLGSSVSIHTKEAHFCFEYKFPGRSHVGFHFTNPEN